MSCRLDSLVEIRGGGTPSKAVPEFWGGDIPWASVKDFKSSELSKTEDYITADAIKNSASNLIPAGSIIVPTRMALGKVATNLVDMAINQDLKALIIKDEKKLDKRYFLRFLESKADYLEKQGKGATVKGITLDVLKELEVPLPPLEEQKRIAAILDKADAIRRKRQQTIKLADNFLSAEFLKRFGDPKDSPFGSKSLKEVTLKITDGAHFTPTYADSGIPFLRVTDINRDKVNWSLVKHIPLEEHQELIKRCRPEKGDVLYSKNGTIGVPKLIDWDQEFSIFVSLCLIKPDPKFLRGRYLYSFLQTPLALKQATQKAKSATVTNLHLVEIKEIKLPVPSLAVQDEWINFVAKFNEMRIRLLQSLDKSNNAFNSLSQKAFSGKI